MELLNRLFNRGQMTDEEYEYGDEYGDEAEIPDIPETVTVSQTELNMHNATQRREYVENCLVRMSEGAAEMEALNAEYNEVTAYLHDIDELGALDESGYRRILDAAAAIRQSEAKREQFFSRSSKMTDDEYAKMESLEGRTLDAIRRFESAEDYHRRIKSDLRRLDNEHEAYLIRKEDLTKTISSTRFLSFACMAALISVVVLLFILHLILQANVVYGYMIAVAFAAFAIVWLYVKNSNAVKELRTVENTLARLILLQNTVKIRYVNNRNLLDYYILKYGVENSKDMKEAVKRYNSEKQLREEFSKEQDKVNRERKRLSNMLTSFGIRYPDVWTLRTEALGNKEKEAEMRRDLMKRRQKLRARMDYNQDKVIDTARNEIRTLARDYPQYADEITACVDAFTSGEGKA